MKINPLRPFNDILSLIFPDICAGCDNILVSGEKYICTQCKFKLPETGFHHILENPVEKHLWGRIRFERASSLLYFNKGLMVQQLMHRFKYGNNPGIGHLLGRYYGSQLIKIPGFMETECIVPVPLFPKKKHKRGYNQSAEFGKGLSDAMNANLICNNLIRIQPTSTQTKKSRVERWENVEGVFQLKYPKKLKGKKVLLVDDVITTGATLEACGSVLFKEAECQLSIATIAFTSGI